MCRDFSFIPLPIWKAGDRHTNIIETLHADVNREGKNSTLVGGVVKGRRLHVTKLGTLDISPYLSLSLLVYLLFFKTRCMKGLVYTPLIKLEMSRRE